MNKYTDKIYNGNVSKQIQWAKPVFKKENNKKAKNEKKSFIDKIIESLFPAANTNKKWKNTKSISSHNTNKESLSLEEEIKRFISMPDDEYNENKLSSKLRAYLIEQDKEFERANANIIQKIAPSSFDIWVNEVNVSGMYARTYYVNSYPSVIDFFWTRWLINMDGKYDTSWFIYPTEKWDITSALKKRATQLKVEINDAYEKWRAVDKDIEIEYQDIQDILTKLATWEEKYFQTSCYTTLYSEETWREKKYNPDNNLEIFSKKFEQVMKSYAINVKRASFRMDEWFHSTTPVCKDELGIYRSMISTSLWGSFPFISNDLIQQSGILYWINMHSSSLVIFDRFNSWLPNYNSIILATSWAWKSFTTKLEVLRYLLLGTEIIIIDPENEYKALVDKVWWTYINISVNSHQYINPFDLPPKLEDREYQEWDLLRSKIMDLIGLISVLVGWLTPEEEAILDTALQQTYALKEIDFNTDPEGKTPPLMEDLLTILEGTEWGGKLAIKLSKYVTGSFGNLFNNYTNIDLDSWLTVFSIRDIEDALKTPAMYNVLNYIWTKTRSKKKKRLLVVDEAWIMMKEEMAANFLFGLIKRARKYKLWVTTITQDVEDFLSSPYGKPIVSNAAMQILLKQSTVSIQSLEKVFNLSEAEKNMLVSANVWEWLLFAWPQHVAVKILASPYEADFIST
jgi:conjugal transfer ATP-binding protein TraC